MIDPFARLFVLASSAGFEWRLDYTGCGVGVDRRNHMPDKDELGLRYKETAYQPADMGLPPGAAGLFPAARVTSSGPGR
jgi:hypothetical protein